MRSAFSVMFAFAAFAPAPIVSGQAVRPLPYSAQLKTDPSVGNIQGIQRYGRQMKTDPDIGEGFSYHVYPVSHQLGVSNTSTVTQGQDGSDRSSPTANQSLSATSSHDLRDMISQFAASGILNSEEAAALNSAIDESISVNDLRDRIIDLGVSRQATKQLVNRVSESRGTGDRNRSLRPNVVQATIGNDFVGPNSAFDWTSGIRKPLAAPPGSFHSHESQAFRDNQRVEQSLSFNAKSGGGKNSGPGIVDVYHQPLIQIKLRVIEVARQDGLAVNSVLNYISREATNPSLTTGMPLNAAAGGNENLSGQSNFPVSGLFNGLPTSGPGTLVNLTSEHINWAASFLASEMNADVVTAPEMVTLNGQNVEFVAGEKLPFALGQNVIQGSNNNIQQVFYKHVGTMVSVTPRIVNWGFHGEGRGEASIQATEVTQWNELITWMADPKHSIVPGNLEGYEISNYVYEDGNDKLPAIPPFELKTAILKELNRYSRRELTSNGLNIEWIGGGECCSCNWSPEDCTIDLALVVRLSQGGTVEDPVANNTVGSKLSAESNVRAVANVIQVKSGHGVVMAGLIGERETDAISKTPILGDLPFIGAAFRSKVVDRAKTEVLIFVEACVLDRDPNMARGQSYEDFWLGKSYVAGGLHDNPLECGLQEVGFGTYLPPHTHDEEVFWERHSRKVQKIGTHIDDLAK